MTEHMRASGSEHALNGSSVALAVTPALSHGCYRVRLGGIATAWAPVIDALNKTDALYKARRIFLSEPTDATFLHSWSAHSGPHTHEQTKPDDLIRHHGHVIKLQRAG